MQHAGTVVSHRPTQSGIGCPICPQTPPVPVRVQGSSYRCDNGHTWNDYGDLMAMNPPMIQVRMPPARQDGWEEVRIAIPGSLRKEFWAKFGEHAAPTLIGLMDQAVQREALSIGEEDLTAIRNHVSIPIKSGAAIKGVIIALVKENADYRDRVEKLQRMRPALKGKENGVTVELEPESLEYLVRKASEEGITIDEFLARFVNSACQNQWM